MQEDHKVSEPNYEGLEMKMPENADQQPSEAVTKSTVINGPILLILTLLLVLILGGMYYWFSTLTTTPVTPTPEVVRPTPGQNNEPESTTAEAQTDMTLVTSPSDELSTIEADLEATNLDGLDAALQNIETELDAALQ
ncbi:hypothetical protein GW937_01485 [Candidatus Kaiserbacteria bacterium]|nr:hypothetical protein [Candidatus Kaiserbacteria bacterium]NCT01689.1 hypothetical protein [Candidatus Parcubacteria bacterium]